MSAIRLAAAAWIAILCALGHEWRLVDPAPPIDRESRRFRCRRCGRRGLFTVNLLADDSCWVRGLPVASFVFYPDEPWHWEVVQFPE